MSFSKVLRNENQDVFESIFRHPFVQGIGTGDVSKEALAHYIKADYEYLNAFMHVYGVAISKSPNREDIQLFNEQIDFVLNSEVHPHNNFCAHIGIPYEELQGFPLPPTADHYIKHMLYHAYQGGIGEILAALLPCPWTYLEIGQELTNTYKPDSSHPFSPWIHFYAQKKVNSLTEVLCSKLDDYAEQASEVEKGRMREAFRKSCQLEYAFWEMAYTQEEWPVGKEVVR
jgi:thiaminase (transcriptional activator TenA)